MTHDELADILERGGATIDRATFPTLMQKPEFAEKVRRLMESGGATVPDSAGFYQKFTPSALAPTQAQEPKVVSGWGDVFFPTLAPEMRRQGMSLLGSQTPDGYDAVSGAATHPVDVGRQVWPMVRDMATMPLRAVAGGATALGQTFGGANGIGDLSRHRDQLSSRHTHDPNPPLTIG